MSDRQTSGAPAPEGEGAPKRNDNKALAERVGRAEGSVREYQLFLLRLVVFLILLWVIFFVFVGAVHMPSTDMSPSINAGDLVIFYRLDKEVRAQDVVVLEKELPDMDGRQLFVCRVVAVAGDTVEISDSDRLIVNGNALIESNIYFPTPPYGGYVEYPLTLGEGECFVLADHREGGTDSRFFGAVARDEITGTAITVIRKNNL